MAIEVIVVVEAIVVIEAIEVVEVIFSRRGRLRTPDRQAGTSANRRAGGDACAPGQASGDACAHRTGHCIFKQFVPN